MKTIGLTGGIGSGKSTVARIFETLGAPVFYADAAGRALLDSSTEVRYEVTKLLGEEAYLKGKANRTWIAQQVFENEPLLLKLNAIIHPSVRQSFLDWKSDIITQSHYCLREAAILFESGSYLDCDQIICVTAPIELRIDRVMKRDGADKANIEKRMSKQLPEEEKAKRSDFIIVNDSQSPLIPQVIAIHKKLSL